MHHNDSLRLFYRALKKLTQLPISADPNLPNLVSATMSEENKFLPEYIQIVQDYDGTYWYQHLLPETHDIYERYIIDPHTFCYRSCMAPLSVELHIEEDVEEIN